MVVSQPVAHRRDAAWSVRIAVGVAVVAFAARMWVVLHGGGFDALAGYDQGVYYAAADAFVHGLRPYGGFLLLHPPGIVLLLSPFAALGSVTSDSTGMAVARFAFVLLGVLNAVLVTRIALRFGRVAAIVGGLFYAMWLPVVGLENQTKLEPLGNTCLLLGLVCLVRRRGQQPPSPRATWLAGAALGAGSCVKIWGVVPLLVVVGWQLLDRGWRPAVRVVAGAAAAAVAICLPFFVTAPDAMLRMVVVDQLGRPPMPVSMISRLYTLSSLDIWSPLSPGSATVLAVVGTLAIIGLLLAWRDRSARVIVMLFLAQTALLLRAPSFFPEYAAFVVPAAALVAAAASAPVARWLVHRGRGFRIVGVGALTAAFVAGALLLAPIGIGARTPFPGAQLSEAAEQQRCVLSDSPIALIEMNVLSRDLRSGCGVRVDVTGYTYDHELDRGSNDRPLSRANNPAWQKQIVHYLTSGSAFILARTHRGTGLSRASMREISRWPVLAKIDGYTVFARNAQQ
jgi:alpha-1,2-mannosyltransferase